MIKEPNFTLKAALIKKYGTIANAARDISTDDLDIDQYRISRIIHRRTTPLPKERRVIAWKLQKPITELFPE